ncbi:hypothetical protein L1887_58494 [Cichorium endivia]|nr:hypothetical protein L1887_58494 [Cichorium endivia]
MRGPTYAPAYAERSIDAPHGYSGSASGVHGMDAYASYPNERYPAESVLGLEAGHAGAAGTAGTGSADVYAHRSDGDHVSAPMHAAGYDGMQRQGAKAEGAGYEGYANVPQEQPQVSEPWQQQQHTQQPQGYGGAYGGDAASGQAYYGQQVRRAAVCRAVCAGVRSGSLPGRAGTAPGGRRGSMARPYGDAWNWTPGQDQPPDHQHPHQQHGHHQQQHQPHQQHGHHQQQHQQQHQPHPHQQGQHHHHQQYHEELVKVGCVWGMEARAAARAGCNLAHEAGSVRRCC